jgi:histidinol dehydrogenase
MRILENKAARLAVSRLERRRSSLDDTEARVRTIVRDVQRGRGQALLRYATLWDGLQRGTSIRVSESEINEAWHDTPDEIRKALQKAAVNVRRFCRRQTPREWVMAIGGAELGQLVRPLASVGCYVPGGRYPLPSTLLMTVIPAQVAGVPRICVVSPRPHQVTLAAAALLGVTEVYRCGGAQAIAALAYGTETIAPVDKIVGPGNKFVTAAKKLVWFDCAIDMLAGPTEAVLYSDDGEPAFLAADMLAQAEHDPDALVVLITTDRRLGEEVKASLTTVARDNPIARQAIRRNAVFLVASSQAEAMRWVNRIAPEHLTIDNDELLPQVRNAGSVFVGKYSAQAAGDYAAGPNHVLPTAGAARFRGGLGVHDFVKLISVQRFDADGLRAIAPVITTLADAEGLKAHAQSVRIRCDDRQNPRKPQTLDRRAAHA